VGKTALSDAKVLVVEDDEQNRALLRRLLARMGITHVRVEDRCDRLAEVASVFDPDLILMDLHVGDVDGLDALEELAGTDPGWSSRWVVVVTGETGDQIDSRTRAAGVADVLVKPYSVDRLRAAVEGALDQGW
jgi:CheY-like chemotaxis protein